MLPRSITPYIVCVIERFGKPDPARFVAPKDILFWPSRLMDRGLHQFTLKSIPQLSRFNGAAD